MISTTEETTVAVPDIGTESSVAYSKRWYVALVRRHHERKISERLTGMGVENFVPIQRKVHQWSDRHKIVDCVLLPMVVFVRVIKGPLVGLTGELITMDQKCKVAVRLNMLGSACVDMSADSVAAVDKQKATNRKLER